MFPSVAPGAQKNPALQNWHDVMELPPGLGLNEPIGHRLHDAGDGAPRRSLYVPAGHDLQTLPLVSPVVFDHVPAAHGVGGAPPPGQ